MAQSPARVHQSILPAFGVVITIVAVFLFLVGLDDAAKYASIFGALGTIAGLGVSILALFQRPTEPVAGPRIQAKRAIIITNPPSGHQRFLIGALVATSVVSTTVSTLFATGSISLKGAQHKEISPPPAFSASASPSSTASATPTGTPRNSGPEVSEPSKPTSSPASFPRSPQGPSCPTRPNTADQYLRNMNRLSSEGWRNEDQIRMAGRDLNSSITVTLSESTPKQTLIYGLDDNYSTFCAIVGMIGDTKDCKAVSLKITHDHNVIQGGSLNITRDSRVIGVDVPNIRKIGFTVETVGVQYRLVKP